MSIGKQSGLIESYSYKDTERWIKGPKPNYWRAPIDNDFGHMMHKTHFVWRQAIDRVQKPTLKFNKEKDFVKIEVQYLIPNIKEEQVNSKFTKLSGDKNVANHNIVYKVHNNGTIEVPLLGTQIYLPKKYNNVKWYGRGPIENYIDRYTAAEVGIYQSKVRDLFQPYIRPQENGNRSDIKWLSITDNQRMV